MSARTARTRRRLAAAVGALVLLAACGRSAGGTDDRAAAFAKLELTTLDGRTVRVADLAGRPAVVNVWQQTCAPCKVEMPAIEQLHRELGDRVRVVGIDSQDDPARAAAFAKEIGITYELWSDELGDVFAALDLSTIPTTIFLDAEGTIVDAHTGAMTADELRRRADSLLAVTT